MKKTDKDAELLTKALVELPPDKDTADALKRLHASATKGERMAKILRGMFDDGVLDPYPTSDTADEYKLRKLCGWRD